MVRDCICVESFMCAEIFYFCNGKVKTLRIHNIWHFANFNLYTVLAKILYLQWYSTDFRNLCLCSKMLRECIWCEKFQVCKYFTFAMARWKTLRIAQHFKFRCFQPVHCASKNPISPMVFNRFSKSLPQLEDSWGRAFLAGKFHMRRYLTFAMARWKLCASTTFEILLLSTCTLCQQKSYISKGIQPIFEIFALCSKILREGILVKSFIYPGSFNFAMATWKLCASTTYEILPLSTCTLRQQRSYIFKGIQPIFEIFASVQDDVEGRNLGRKVWYAHVFYFCSGKVKILRIHNIWNFATSQPVQCGSKNPISRKVFNRFSKSLPQLKEIEGGHLGGKFHMRRYFTFAMAGWKLCASTTFEILQLSTCTLCQQKSNISKDIQQIFEIFTSTQRY